MYIIQANCHVLFELTQKLALKVGFPLPRPVSDPGGFISKCLPRLLAWGWAVCSNSGRVGRQQPERLTVKNVFLRRLGRWPTSQSRLLFSQQCKNACSGPGKSGAPLWTRCPVPPTALEASDDCPRAFSLSLCWIWWRRTLHCVCSQQGYSQSPCWPSAWTDDAFLSATASPNLLFILFLYSLRT